MNRIKVTHLRRMISSVLLAVGLLTALAISVSRLSYLLSDSVSAATPSSGTLSQATPVLTYTAGPFLTSNPTAQAGEPVCNAATPCDEYTLTVNGPASLGTTHNVVVTIQWDLTAEDYDLYVRQSGATIKDSASSSDPEVVTIDANPGVYTVRAIPFAAAGGSFNGKIELVPKPTTPPPVAPGPGTPRYHNFAAPGTMGNSAGEPSLGVGKPIAGHPDGRTMFIAGLETLRVTWDDCPSPAGALWENVSAPTTSTATLDPILFTDFQTGRTFVSQLGPKTSFLAFTDNDGGVNGQAVGDWTPSQGSGINSGVDHQTVSAGPFAPGLPDGTGLYPNAVYYASQDVAVAQAAISRDGGLTFGPAVPMYNLTQCGGLHGHVKVAPDGTVYNPNRGCGGNQAVVVSEDEGVTWTVRPVPGSSPGDTDPSVGIDASGKVYFAFSDGDGHAKVAVSSNKGATWSTPIDVGAAFSIKNSVFPAAVGGDSGRASVMYLATDTGGNYQAIDSFTGVWHIYAAHTFDGGATWTTVRATPENDPVQRGSICTSGTTCGADRNLLDFNDIGVDHEGRTLIAYADGCIGCTSPTGADSRAAKATIARQSGGKRLFAAFDPAPEPNPPAAPLVNSVARDSGGVVHLSWSEPDNGGAPLTSYKVYRKVGAGGSYGAALATVTVGCPTCKTDYDDTTALPNTQYFYKVTAVNSEGEGPNCGDFPIGTAVPVESACVLPGLTILTDATGDELDALPSHDVQYFALAEPFGLGSPDKLVFTLKVDSLSTVPANTLWPVEFDAPNGTRYVAQMSTVPPATIASPAFEYGEASALVFTPADPASTFDPDGTIRIVVPRSGVGNPAIGQNLTGFLTRIAVFVGAVTLTPDNMPDSLAPSGSYTIVGNSFCRPNTAPIALLTANPTSGSQPLTVNFNGSGSSDEDTEPPPDSIVSYTFNFGDGSPEVTCPSAPGCTGATVNHTYTDFGEYPATLRVADSRGKVSTNPARVVIHVQGPPPSPGAVQFSAANYNVGEAAGSATITVTRANGSDGAVSVQYATSNGTATAGQDYTTTSGTLNFADGETSKTFAVSVTDDALDESDETVNLTLSSPTGGATLGTPSAAVLTIVDNDPLPSLSIDDVSANEGNSGTTNFTFTVTLSAASGQSVTVNYATADGTATASSDYQTQSGTLTFTAGQTSKSITVLVNGDIAFETNENFSVNLSNAINATIADTQGIGTILNDDTLPTVQFSASTYNVNEGSDSLAISVTRSGDTSSASTVKYATSDATDVNFQCNPANGSTPAGAASRKCDYHIAVGRLRFAAGETSKQIILSIVKDVYVEPTESLTITLSNPTGSTVGTPSLATINITDNDTAGQANPIDGTPFYVRMLYVDLLSREPDPQFASWVHRIDFCGQPGEPPPPCDRVTVGGDGFLRSAEFFDREFFVIRLYRTALGRILRYDDVGDLAYVSGFLTDADLELNKQEVVTDIMSRSEFSGMYNSLTNAQYVDTMIQTAAVTLPAGVRDGWVNALNSSTKTRAQVFRELSERSEVSAKYLHEAQVVSCYYGFFTRNPDGAYFTFLQRYDNGEITLGDLANAFINAAEYRQRFGP